MASDDDIEKLKAQNFEEPNKHNDEIGPVGSLFESCVQILRSLSTKARELDAASRKNYHPDGSQRSESANESSSAQSRKGGRVRKMAKSGCVTCRKRKKMCDEGKPECNKCVRDGFICDGYIVKSTQQKPEAPNSNPSGQETETFSESRQSLPLDGAASQLLVKTLESNVATLLFWDDEFGALSGHLDKALEHSEENRDLTLAILISLADFLSHDLLNATLPLPAYRDDIRQKANIHARVHTARGIIMDTETTNREETRNIQDVCEILGSKVARLNVLGPILEESIPSGAAFEQVAAHGQLVDRPAHQYYADQISIRFPNASASLVEILGKCNWERYMRIHKSREENAQREGSPIGEMENMSKFHDSALGTSVPAQSAFGNPQKSFAYAETEVSKRAESSHRRLPPLPEEGRRGKPFLCEVCNSVVRIKRTGAWKKHIFSDVLAYVCIFDDCPCDRCFFEDRDGLTAHLGTRHGFAPAWKSETCPLCLEETGDGMNTISLHFSRHMEEVALGAIPRTAESDAGSDESSSEASSRESNATVNDNDEDEDALHRSLARRRKADRPGDILHICADCKKGFKRPCDLTKHEKTHARPWKCPEVKCKYHDLGWLTEKERDRHVNDKHIAAPPQYKCLFPPCAYASKRQSNCKAHMEKAHGWNYVRSKRIRKGTEKPYTSLTPNTPLTPFIDTPALPTSFNEAITTPDTNFNHSADNLLFDQTFNFNPNLQQVTPDLSNDDSIFADHFPPLSLNSQNLNLAAETSPSDPSISTDSRALPVPSFMLDHHDRHMLSTLPEYSSRGMSPFKQGSPVAAPSSPSDHLSSAQMHQVNAKLLRKKQKARNNDESYQSDEGEEDARERQQPPRIIEPSEEPHDDLRERERERQREREREREFWTDPSRQ